MQRIKSIFTALMIGIISFSMLFMTTFFSTTEVYAAGQTYYVSDSLGDDTRTAAQAQQRNTPWKTIQKAADTLQAGDTCIILAGTYRESVVPVYSGTEGNPITYKADAGAVVTISGLDKVTSSWTNHSGNIYKTIVALPLGDDNQVFVDSTAMMWARWPNSTHADWAMNPTYAVCDSGTTLSKIVDADIPNIDWTGGRVFHTPITAHGWACWETSITASDNNSVQFNAPLAPHWDKNGSKAGTQYYLSGKLEALDVEKEWYYDSSNTTLYLYAVGGVDPATKTVEYKTRNWGFDLSGKSYITLEEVDFFGTSLKTDDSTSHCTINKMKAEYIWNTTTVENNHYSLVTNPYSGIVLRGDYNEIKNSEIAYSDGNGIVVSGKWNRIVNNYIHDCNYKGAYAANIYLMGENILVSHNTLTRSGRSLITGNLGFLDCIIQYNDLSYPGFKTRDGGVSYWSWVNAGNTEIHHNIIRDGNGHEGGIYIDNNVHGMIVYNNLMYNIHSEGNGALCFGGPNEYVSFVNNSTYDAGDLEGGWPPKSGSDYLGSYFINNIAQDELFVAGEITYLYNHTLSYVSPGYKNTGNKDFTLVDGAATVDSGIEVPGITDGYMGDGPDKGAFEKGKAVWKAGHSFDTTPNPTYSQVSYLYKNHVKNPGFDTNNFNGWTKTGTSTAQLQYDASQTGWGSTSGLTNTGPYAVKLGSGVNGLEQIITGLTPSTKYRLSGWVKVDSGETASIGVKDFGQAEVSVTQSASSFTRKILSFSTGPDSTTATIYIKKTSSGNNNVIWDDIGLQYMEPHGEINIANQATVSASSIYSSDYSGDKINDKNMTTRWSASQANNQWIEYNFGSSKTFDKTIINECTDYGNRINAYKIQYHNGSSWVDITTGTSVGANKINTFSPITASRIRLYITSASDNPTIWEFKVYNTNAALMKNLAKHATATASSTYSSLFTADKVNDELSSTRWSANTANNQWIELNFGGVVTFNTITTKQCIDYGDRIQSYKYQYYNGSSWVDIVTGSTIGAEKTDTFPSVTAGKVRLYVTSATDNPTIWEIEVYDDSPAGPENIAKSATTSSSSNWSAAYVSSKANDGISSTRWSAQTKDNQWIELDFGENKTFNKTIIKECIDYGARIQSYTIQYYYGSTWVDITTGTNMRTHKTDTFSSITASKIRLNVTSASDCPTIWEFEVYND